ncbi:GspH/FimT family pseudopilin [[Pseudomonas] boreopolis]|uniref:Type II secretion system protein H n=1 Tax=Xanthomonas boreopolis TaxID=86183 RepID=A0A919F7E1_9XANT|nr:pre-pilin like leader sequence [[Pseudomonas] boreopolis]
MSPRRIGGFTLVELMVTVVVLAILSAIAYPSFQGVIRSNRVSSASNEALALLSLARSEAIRNRRGAGVCGSSTGEVCDDDWAAGMLAWSDADGNGVYQTGETVLRFVAIDPALQSAGPAATVAFDSRGRRRGDVAQEISLQPVSCGEQELRRVLTINASGQIRIQKEACS